MYIPRYNAVDDVPAVHRMVQKIGSAEFVTVDPEGTPIATLLPVMWSDDGLTVIAHMARANQHWKSIAPGSRALAIVTDAQAYISPAWYPSKAEHERVVPTWNYSSVHLTGTLTVHDDLEWVRKAVTDLTTVHESTREVPWAVTDAPERFVHGQLKAIIGLELKVERVEAKVKLSQNQSRADQDGVILGLESEGGHREGAVAEQMRGFFG